MGARCTTWKQRDQSVKAPRRPISDADEHSDDHLVLVSSCNVFRDYRWIASKQLSSKKQDIYYPVTLEDLQAPSLSLLIIEYMWHSLVGKKRAQKVNDAAPPTLSGRQGERLWEKCLNPPLSAQRAELEPQPPQWNEKQRNLFVWAVRYVVGGSHPWKELNPVRGGTNDRDHLWIYHFMIHNLVFSILACIPSINSHLSNHWGQLSCS